MSRIEWTGKTWNPTTGCTKVSPGCKHCYAESIANRFKDVPKSGYANGFNLTLHEYRLSIPLKRKKPTTYFVNSMSDLFHTDIPDSFIEKVMAIIEQTPRHTYQVLTKRADRLPDYFNRHAVPDNAWIGVSVEDRKYGLPRIDHLRQVNTQHRFLSIEPLLEDLGMIDLTGIDWVIVGGESGRGARSLQPDWVRGIRDQCQYAGIPFFFKQWGGVNKGTAGKTLDGSIWIENPALVAQEAFV